MTPKDMTPTFHGAETFLGNRESKAIENNTKIVRRDKNTIAVQYHETDIVTYYRDGTVELDTGGWLTSTTKERLNRYSDGTFRVASDKGKWYLYTYYNWEKVCRFFDGIRLKGGTVLNPQPRASLERAEQAEKRMLASISKYVSAYLDALEGGYLDTPSGGDCWYCSMFKEAGGTDHLIQHMKEMYFVPSLLLNAYKDKGVRIPEIALTMDLDFDELQKGKMKLRGKEYRKYVSPTLRRYLKKQLLPTLAR